MNDIMYEKIKEQILKEASVMRKLNREVPVSGQRIDLPVKDRMINIVFYKAKCSNAPLILAFHGGGYLFGGNALNDIVWNTLSERLQVNIASVEYRKSPEFQYQEAIDDAYDAAMYLYHRAEEFEFDKERISVMGGSAGAGLAASLCIYAKKEGGIHFKNQILLYPFLDCATDPDSKGEGSLTGPIMYIFNELHCTPEEARLPLVSPVFAKAKDLKNLPNTFINLADYDALKHEGLKYGQMLKQAGVPVHVTFSEGMPHGYFEFGFGKPSENEIEFLSDLEKDMIKNGDFARASEKTLEEISIFLNENE